MAIPADVTIDQLPFDPSPDLGTIFLANKSDLANPPTYSTVAVPFPAIATVLARDFQMAVRAAGAVAGNLATLDADGDAVDAGVRLGYDGTATTIPNAAQVDAAIAIGLLNTPDLPAVALATLNTSNDSLSGLAARDGVTPVAGDYVLVRGQTNGGNNGIWRAAAGAWVRQKRNGNAYADVTGSESSIDALGIAGGIVNVLGGTVGKNLQFSIQVPNKSAAVGTGLILAVQVTKNAVRDTFNNHVSANIGNDSANVGSVAFPFATIGRALQGAGFPCTITCATGGVALAESVSYTSGHSNRIVQVSDQGAGGGRLSLTGQHTLGTGNTRVTFKGMSFSRASDAPIMIGAGNAGRHQLENVTLTTGGANVLGIDPSMTNWLTFRNVDTTGNPFATVPLPAFSNAVVFNIFDQKSVLPFGGNGSASLTIRTQNCAPGLIRVPGTFAGRLESGGAWNQRLGSFSHPAGIVIAQSDLNTIVGHTVSSVYDGFYALSGFAPTGFPRGAIIGKQSGGGYTAVWLERTFEFAPGSLSDIAGVLYTQVAATGDWAAPPTTATIPAGSITATELDATGVTPGAYGSANKNAVFTVDDDGRLTAAGEVASAGGAVQFTLASRPTVAPARGENTTLGVVEELTASGWKPATDLPVAGLITTKSTVFISGLYINNSGASIGTLNVGAAGYYDGAAWTDNVYLLLNLPVAITVGGIAHVKSGVKYVAAQSAQLAQRLKCSNPDQTVQAVAAGSAVKFTRLDIREGSAISINAAGDQITFQPGYTYSIRGSHGLGCGAGALVESRWVDVGTNVELGNKATVASPVSTSALGYNPAPAEHLFAPSAVTTLELRITYINNAAALGYEATQGTDQQPWFDAEATSAPFVVPTSPGNNTTTTILRSGAGVYTKPAGCIEIHWRGVAVGGPGSGGGSNIGGSVSNATPGTDTTFGGLTLKAGPVGYASNPDPVLPAGWDGYTIGGRGGAFGDWTSPSATVPGTGGPGAASPFGDGGAPGTSGYGAQPPTAPGAGGGGGGTYGVINSQCYGGLGGGCGDFAEFTIKNPAATYAYSIGTLGVPGGPGTSGNGGAQSGVSIVIITEYY